MTRETRQPTPSSRKHQGRTRIITTALTLAAGLAVLLFGIAGVAQASSHCDATVNDGQDIQGHLDAASPGDTICVEEVAFDVTDTVTINTADITLQSLDQNPWNPRITYDPGTDTYEPTLDIQADGVTVDGFTIERVASETDTAHVRALQISGAADVTVQNSWILGTADPNPDAFAGIMVHDAFGSVTNLTLENNHAEGFVAGYIIVAWEDSQARDLEADLIGNTASDNDKHGFVAMERDVAASPIDAITGAGNDFTGNAEESILLSDGGNLFGWTDTQPVDPDVIAFDGPILVEAGDSLQTANDVAAEGALVDVGAGTYEESVVLDVPGLTLSGDAGAKILLDTATATSDDERALTLAADGALVENIDIERVVSDSVNNWVRAVQFSADGEDSAGELRNLDVSITGETGPTSGTAAAIVASNFESPSFAVEGTLTSVGAVSESTQGAAVVVNSHGPDATVTIADSALTDSFRGLLVMTDGQATVEDTTIEGNDIGVENQGGSAVATHNWWGDASGPFHTDDNPDGDGNEALGDVDFDPWWANGALTILATNDGLVDNLDQGASYLTIQDAIDTAATGDTLLVAAGTYDERVTIDVDGLTLASEEDHEATIRFDPGSHTYRPTVDVDADDVTVDGFVIERTFYDGSSHARAIEISGASDTLLSNNHIVGDIAEPAVDRASGVQIVNSAPVQGATLEDNHVEGVHEAYFIRAWGGGGSNTVSDIQLDGNTASDNVHGLAVSHEAGSVSPEAISGSGNDFTGNTGESIALSPDGTFLGHSSEAVDTDQIAFEDVILEEGDAVSTGLDVIADDGAITLRSGTYAESVEIDVAGITLAPETRLGATIEGPAIGGTPAVNILAENVTVEDLRIVRDSGNSASHEQALTVRASNAVVEGNEILGDWAPGLDDRYDGIMVLDGSGAEAQDVSGVTIVDNHVEGFYAGIVVSALFDHQVEDIEVDSNTATNNQVGFAAWFEDGQAQPLNIFGAENLFLDNDEHNIFVAPGGTFQGRPVADFDANEVEFAIVQAQTLDNLDEMIKEAAAFGGILELHEGTYDQSVTIDKPLTLTSVEGADVTIALDDASGTPVVSIESDFVRVMDLSIERTDSSNAIAQGIRVSGSNALVENVAIQGGGPNDQGISVLDAPAGESAPTNTSDVDVRDVDIQGFTVGIGVATQSNDATLANVTIEDARLSGNDVGVGLAVFGVAEDSPDNVLVRDSHIQNNGHGVYLFGDDHPQIGENVTGDITLRNNVIQSNTDSGLTNDGDTQVDARENYWGSTLGPTEDDGVALPGTGDLVQGPADTLLWCIDADCYTVAASTPERPVICIGEDCTALPEEATVETDASLVPSQDIATGGSSDASTGVECTSVRGASDEHRLGSDQASDDDAWTTTICTIEAFGHTTTPHLTVDVINGALTVSTS